MKQEELSELLGLMAAEVISSDDTRCHIELAASSPAIDVELRSLQDAVASIAYTEKPLPIPASLKKRLFDRIQQEPEGLGFVALRSGELIWKPHPIEGLVVAILNIDPIKREVSSLVRAEVTVEYRLHHHVSGEEIFMLEGELIDRGVTYKAGDYLYSKAGSVHSPTAIAGCMFFVKTSLDDTFLR